MKKLDDNYWFNAGTVLSFTTSDEAGNFKVEEAEFIDRENGNRQIFRNILVHNNKQIFKMKKDFFILEITDEDDINIVDYYYAYTLNELI